MTKRDTLCVCPKCAARVHKEKLSIHLDWHAAQSANNEGKS